MEKSKVKSRQVMIRLDENHERMAKEIMDFFKENYGLNITLTELIKMCIHQEYNNRRKEQ